LPSPGPPTVLETGTTRYEVKEKSSNYIRINLDDLDRLISSTHKLFRQTTNFLDQAVKSVDVERAQQLQSERTAVNDSFLTLASELVDLRMVTIDRTLHRTLRAGRAVARAAGKEIDFVVRGEGLMLDKSLAEAIADPLIHLVRNAVDHGIENANERLRSGKSDRGRIVIEAANVQGQTQVTVSDDGCGIDAGLVSEAAALLGVVPPGSQLGLQQCLRIIFRRGFSTARQVSATSGRGVGLDAVETAIEQVGGGIRVASVAGKGASFEILLPVTFGLLDVVVVEVDDKKYLIDAAHVIGSQSFAPENLEITGPMYCVRVDDGYLKLQFLSQMLGSRVPSDPKGTLLICQPGKNEFTTIPPVAVLVDEVTEAQKVLVRNLGSRGSRWFGVAGASELRDGTVALLLDLPRLLNS
jgi:two-component system chemotaxis sensor kinase CheA